MSEVQEYEDGIKKSFNCWLLLNWRTGDIKMYKLKPADKKVGAYHVPVQVNLDVVVPDKPDVKAEGTIQLGESKVNDMRIAML